MRWYRQCWTPVSLLAGSACEGISDRAYAWHQDKASKGTAGDVQAGGRADFSPSAFTLAIRLVRLAAVPISLSMSLFLSRTSTLIIAGMKTLRAICGMVRCWQSRCRMVDKAWEINA